MIAVVEGVTILVPPRAGVEAAAVFGLVFRGDLALCSSADESAADDDDDRLDRLVGVLTSTELLGFISSLLGRDMVDLFVMKLLSQSGELFVFGLAVQHVSCASLFQKRLSCQQFQLMPRRKARASTYVVPKLPIIIRRDPFLYHTSSFTHRITHHPSIIARPNNLSKSRTFNSRHTETM